MVVAFDDRRCELTRGWSQLHSVLVAPDVNVCLRAPLALIHIHRHVLAPHLVAHILKLEKLSLIRLALALTAFTRVFPVIVHKNGVLAGRVHVVQKLFPAVIPAAVALHDVRVRLHLKAAVG